MMSERDIVEQWLNKMKARYGEVMDAKGITASGKSKERSAVIMEDKGGRIEVPLYNKALVLGRQPNINHDKDAIRRWVGYFGENIIKPWCRNKGIEEGAAFAIAYKIARKGWQVPNSYNDGRLISDTFTDSAKAELTGSISKFYTTKIIEEIYKKWQP